jgi:tetratricopeptide (TPR) repeat protein
LTAGTLAEVLERAGRAEEAVHVLEEAAAHLEEGDASLGIRLRRLTMLADHEMWPELAEGASELLAAGNEELRASALQLKAEALAGLGDLDAALELLSANGGNRLALATRVELLMSHDRGAEAEKLLAGVVDGGTPEDLFFAARLYQRLERYDDVVALMQRLVQDEPESLQALFLLGAAQERRGSRSEAETTFKSLLDKDPDHAPTLNYLGYMWAETAENLDDALELILRAVAIDPDNGAYVDSLGWVYYQLGRYEEARQHLEWAARLIPGDSTLFEHLGDLYLRLDERHRARDFYQQALQLSGDNLDSVRRKLEDLEGEGL